MKRILIPTDFSKSSDWALEVGCNIAKRAKAEIILLHIVEQPTSESFNVEGEVNHSDDWEEKLFTVRLIEKNKAQLASLAARVSEQGISVVSELRLGNPYHGIRTRIKDLNVDLVVMGSFGHTRLEEIIVGSTTQKVVRFAKCPVLTVHQKPGENDFKNIVYATSMSEDEKAFADVVINAQQLYDAKIHLVRINTPMNFRPDVESMKIMKRFAEKLHLQNYTLNIFNDQTEEKGIINFASIVNADLIAMATHGRTGFAHALVGSIAEDVVNHAQRPVLTFVTPNLYQN